MPTPVTSGHPRDWRTAKQSPRNGLQLKARAAANSRLPCRTPGCTSMRSGVSRYCGPHRDTSSERGDPVSRIPARNELVIFRKAVDVYLHANPALSSRITGDLKSLEATMHVPRSFCLGPADMHPKLPQVAKATGLKANWLHKRGRTYADAVTHTVALMGWMGVYWNGLHENRTAFLRTRAGALMGSFSSPTAKMHKEVSGATKRHLGAELLHHAETIFGRDFWSSPVALTTGQDMTILSYTRLALRAAKLL
jgi:hypothetical protein